jgi:hypothetical protein
MACGQVNLPDATNAPMTIGVTLMHRRITIMVGGLFLAGMALLPGFAQAAVAQSPARAVLVSATPSPATTVPAQTGADFGRDVELFAADLGIAGAAAALGVGIAYYLRRRRDRGADREAAIADREAALRLESLESALSKFRVATDEYRIGFLGSRRGDESVPASLEESAGVMAAAKRKTAVQDCALQLVGAASICGDYGERVVRAARRLMEELGIEWPPSSDLVAVEAELQGIRPSQARKLIERS